MTHFREIILIWWFMTMLHVTHVSVLLALRNIDVIPHISLCGNSRRTDLYAALSPLCCIHTEGMAMWCDDLVCRICMRAITINLQFIPGRPPENITLCNIMMMASLGSHFGEKNALIKSHFAFLTYSLPLSGIGNQKYVLCFFCICTH